MNRQQWSMKILRTSQTQLMYGQQLNLTSSETTIEGEMVTIFVDRFRLLATTFDELVQIYDNGCDFRTPLQVAYPCFAFCHIRKPEAVFQLPRFTMDGKQTAVVLIVNAVSCSFSVYM